MKIINYDVEIKSTKINRTFATPKVYTNDLNSVVFQFNVLDMTTEELTGASATTLLYMRDGSFFQNASNDVALVGNVFSYTLKENEGNHGGLAQIQLVVKIGTKEYATQLYNFEIVNGLETKVAQEVMIYDWTTLTRDARAYIDQFVADEAVRQQQFETAEANRVTFFEAAEINRAIAETNRVSVEQSRVTAETGRVNAESSRVTAESGRVSAEQARVNAESTRAQNYATYDSKIAGLEERTNYIEGYIDYREQDILGIEADFANSTFTRIAGAVGLTPGTSFDAFNPFGGRKRCIITDTGVRLAYFGQAGYTETGKTTTELIVGGVTYPVGTIVQVMVEQPKFYYKVVPLKLDKVQDGKGFHLRKARYYVSAEHKAGFKIHPAFVRNGKEKNFIYLSAYEGALYDDSAAAYILDDAQVADFATDKLSSISGTKPASGLTQNLTRANTRKLAQNRGLGWEQAYGATVAATQLLFAIEYASFNTQTAIGMGVSKTDVSATNQSEPTGATTLLGNTSGKADNGSITYRGEENFWMNIWKWVDGLNIEAKGLHNLFVADNAFADDVGTTPYQDAGITLAKTSGYISAFAYNEKFDWLFFPSETSGNSSVPVGDNFYQNNASSSWLAAVLGGRWADGTIGGGFCWAVFAVASARDRARGGRLVYVPGVVA